MGHRGGGGETLGLQWASSGRDSVPPQKVIKNCNRLTRKVVESASLKVFTRHAAVVLKHMV